MKRINRWRSFGGWQDRYEHNADSLACTMRLSVYIPPQAIHEARPVLWWLSGLTCTDENFVHKAGAQRLAAELGLVLVVPDTSPRNTGINGEDEDWDFGSGAGFYLNATQTPWSRHYRMYDYLTDELPALLADNLLLDLDRQAISGHSMGGHGALVLALRNPGRFQSVSAFAPICAPMRCPWGRKAFTGYLGDDESSWRDWDASELVASAKPPTPMLIDQGLADEFLPTQLCLDEFEAATSQARYPLTVRRRDGYDHSYFYIASFIDEHLAYHASALGL